MTERNLPDQNPNETQDWLEALASLVREEGAERAQYILQQLAKEATRYGLLSGHTITTDYVNTIPPELEAKLPDDYDPEITKRISSMIRWNAIAMVLRAGKKSSELGGHIATYASAATLYDIGFQYFFRGRTENFAGDLVYIQGHSSPGIYARAFLEGRITEEQLDNFRQEVGGKGISSYPHPWLMPNFWQFPTVSMGLGPIQAIYQARFLKYQQNRGLIENEGRKVWAFLGDGEMDEPESLGAIAIAVREKLDNLIFVVNCNLQRLDGPVRGNSKIIQELEGIFRGAGWNVIKVLWGENWDPLFEKDKTGLLKKRMMECVDGEYQNFRAKDGAYVRENFFNKYEELKELVKDMSDEDIWFLRRGGHDPQKVYAAYHAAVNHKGTPTVILAKTIKGYGMGTAGEGLNITHQQKKMSVDDLKAFAKRFDLEIAESKVAEMPYFYPGKSSKEVQYLLEHRKTLGGFIPERHAKSEKLKISSLEIFKTQLESSGEREISTTMAFVRILNELLKDANLKKYIVPIVPDESRTFGMEGLFRQIGIYAPEGQLYEPVDRNQVMYYREEKDGQLLEEGINEAGAFCSWIAAATSYANTALPMIPFYIYYSMFGFQRIGDFAWAAGDMRARGFLLGATAGRTTLAGEGLQHDDGHSHILSSVIPNCRSYDPTFAYEVAVIIHYGLKRMYQEQRDEYFYITLMNENYPHPAMPKDAEEGIIKGLYLLKSAAKNKKHQVHLLGSGTILREVIAAAEILENQYDVACNIWSATSFTELRREALAIERENWLNPSDKPKLSYVEKCLSEKADAVIAASDYIRLFADQIRKFVPHPYYVLGTDGYGRSDTREHLRYFFEVDRNYIAYVTLAALFEQGKITLTALKKAQAELKIDPKKPNPVEV